MARLMRTARSKLPLLAALVLGAASLPEAAAQPGGGQTAGGSEVADVVIAGGGPAGMAAAIEARRAGAKKVILLERRGPERQRHHVLGLLPGGLDVLERIGLKTRRLKGEKVRYHSIDGRRLPIKSLRPDARKASSRIDHRVERITPSMMVETRHLEMEMQKLVQRTGGIELRYHSPVTGAELARESGKTQRGPPGSEPVTVTTESPGGEVRKVKARFLVVADGAHSPTRGYLGVDYAESKALTQLMVGVFKKRGDGGFEGIYNPKAKDSARSVYRLGGETTGVVVEPPPGMKFKSEKEKLRFFRKEAKRVGASGKLLLEPRVTPIEIRKTKVNPQALGHQVFFIGEADRSTHAHSVSGGSWALKDAIRVGEALGVMLKTRDARESKRAYRRFVTQTNQAAEALHRRLGPYFQASSEGLLKLGGLAPQKKAATRRGAQSKRRGWRKRIRSQKGRASRHTGRWGKRARPQKAKAAKRRARTPRRGRAR